MAVKIGHASIDENGKAQGGAAGDQTKKEVNVLNVHLEHILQQKDHIVNNVMKDMFLVKEQQNVLDAMQEQKLVKI